MANGGEFGVIGLGKMGGGLALLALERGMRVVGLSRGGAADELKKAGLVEVEALAGFREELKPPRVVLLYIPAGRAVDDILDGLTQSLEPGDIVADGGNSYWGDSIRRHRRLQAEGIEFVDVGTSGGVDGARHGACFMVGGEREAVVRLEPLLRVLATDLGYVRKARSQWDRVWHDAGDRRGLRSAEALPRAARHRRGAGLVATRVGDPILAHRSSGRGVQDRSAAREAFLLCRGYRRGELAG
jgi:6-phosphogluconate dehydrogenase